MSDQSLRCDICSHYCEIAPGKVGICGVHKNEGEKIALINYGKAIAVHNDPIEKKPLYHFFPGSAVLSVGCMGCNFRCSNCQNWEIAQIGGKKCHVADYDKIGWGYHLPPKQLVQGALKCKSKSVAYTYNEPTIFLEYALDCMIEAKKAGLYNVWVSNGFMSDETLDKILPHLDAINIDLKSMDPGFYRKICGARLEPVLKNIQRIHASKTWIEITTLAIPTLSDSEELFYEIANFIMDKLGPTVPWHISAFRPAYKLKNLPPSSLNSIERACEIGQEIGLYYVYGGNVPGKGLENSYCPNCKKAVIERLGYRTNMYHKSGVCPSCKTQIHGVFEDE